VLCFSAFNQLEQYASSPGKTDYTDAKKLAPISPMVKPTNQHKNFYRPDALPVAQPTVVGWATGRASGL